MSAEEAGGPQYGFNLAGGRRIQMLALDQWWSGEGLRIGFPLGEVDQRTWEWLLATYAGQDGGNVPLVLKPVAEAVEQPERRSSGRRSVARPAATCAARFWSEKLAGDDQGIASLLRVIWFQDDFAFPIDRAVVAELEALDWEANAWSWRP
jgi:hypothetical protein